MRKLLFVFVMLFACMYLPAQDVIIKKSGTVLNCRIISADSSAVVVKYNIDGYIVDGSIKREEIKEILFNYKSAEAPPPVKTVSVNDEETPFRPGTKYYISAGFALPIFKGDTRSYADGISEEMKIYPRIFPFDLGVGFEQRIRKELSLMGGFEYAQKGIMYFGKSSTGEQKLWDCIKVNYIEIPFSMKVYPASLMKRADREYFVKVGVAPAIMVSSREKIKAVDGSDKVTETVDFDGTTDADLNLLVSVGYMFSNRYAIEVIYEQGSCNVMEKEYAPWTFYNRSLMFNINFIF